MSQDKTKYFRCVTCESPVYLIHKYAPNKEIPIIDFHKDCKIEYYTAKQYKEYANTVTPKSHTTYNITWFLRKGRIINRMGLDFDRGDYPELTASNFRQYVRRAIKKGLIEKTDNFMVPSYRLVGEKTGKNYAKVTREGMGVGLEFEKILRDTCIAYPKIHDIRIKTNIEGLYEILGEKYSKGKGNGRISLDRIALRPYIFATISVYPKTLEVSIACSRNPVIYDTKGAQEFVLMLSEIQMMIMSEAGSDQVMIPSILEWIVTQYHFNKDGNSKQYSGQQFEVKVKAMNAGLIRFYSKLFPDGITRTRLEQIRSPHTVILDEIRQMIKTDNFINNKQGITLTSEEASDILDIIPEARSDKPQNINLTVTLNGRNYNPFQESLFSF